MKARGFVQICTEIKKGFIEYSTTVQLSVFEAWIKANHYIVFTKQHIRYTQSSPVMTKETTF